jgi:hypothetical protein
MIIRGAVGLKASVRLYPFADVGGDTSLASRGRVAKAPYPGEVIFCLAWILGESRDSGLRLGLDAKAKLAIISAKPERFSGKSLDGVPGSRSGPIIGDFDRLWDSQTIRGG